MCDRDDRRPPRDFGPRDFDRPDFDPRRRRDEEPPSTECRECLDPVDWLREAIEGVTEDAFLELVEQRVKARLEAVWGERLDSLVNLVVDHFVRMREVEITTALAESELDAKLRDTLRKER